MSDELAMSRRALLVAGGYGVVGAMAAGAQNSLSTAPPVIDTGRVTDGKVQFPD